MSTCKYLQRVSRFLSINPIPMTHKIPNKPNNNNDDVWCCIITNTMTWETENWRKFCMGWVWDLTGDLTGNLIENLTENLTGNLNGMMAVNWVELCREIWRRYAMNQIIPLLLTPNDTFPLWTEIAEDWYDDTPRPPRIVSPNVQGIHVIGVNVGRISRVWWDVIGDLKK